MDEQIEDLAEGCAKAMSGRMGAAKVLYTEKQDLASIDAGSCFALRCGGVLQRPGDAILVIMFLKHERRPGLRTAPMPPPQAPRSASRQSVRGASPVPY